MTAEVLSPPRGTRVCLGQNVHMYVRTHVVRRFDGLTFQAHIDVERAAANEFLRHEANAATHTAVPLSQTPALPLSPWGQNKGLHQTQARGDVVQGDRPGQERAQLRGPGALLRAVRWLHGRNHELGTRLATGNVPSLQRVFFSPDNC